MVARRRVDDCEWIGSVLRRHAHGNELTPVVHAVAELDDRGVAAVVLSEQGGGRVRGLPHRFDGVEQRHRAHVEASVRRLSCALVPTLEDRPYLTGVANDDGIARFAQCCHAFGKKDLRRFVDDDPVEQRVLGQVVADRKAGGRHDRVGAQEDARLPVQPLIGAQPARTFALKSVQEGAIECFAGAVAIGGAHLVEAVAGGARLRFLDAAAEFAFAGLVEGELER